MAYEHVDQAFRAPRTPGDLRGRIEASLVRRATTRAVANNEDQREWQVIRAVLDGTYPDSWVLLVVSLIDVWAGQQQPASNVVSATVPDAQIDAAVGTAFSRLALTR